MTLHDWLDNEGIPARALAKQIGVSTSSVFKWRIGMRRPRSEVIAKLEKITKGKVKFEDWLHDI